MPYPTNDDLPAELRRQLPPEALDIYRSVFNAAIGNKADDPIEDADAHNLAWEAVKRVYVKEGGEWVARGVLG